MRLRLCVLTTLVAAFAALLPHAARASAIGVASFRGSDEVVLARAPGITVTEADLFLFSVLLQGLDPELVADWRELTEGQKRSLREMIDLYLQFRINAGLADRESFRPFTGDPELAERATRLQAGRAAMVVWADTIVRESIDIFPEDILYAFKENREEYVEEATARVRRLRVPLEANATTEQREAALSRAEQLRDRARRGDGLEPLLAEDPSLLIDPPGRIVVISESEEDLDPRIVEAAFDLGISQISEPIRTAGGYVLLEVVDRTEGERADLRALLPEILADLEDSFLPRQFDYLMLQTLIDTRPINRARLYPFMPDDAEILRVRDVAITRAEYRRLYPETIGDPEDPNRRVIEDTIWQLMLGETVTRQLDLEGLAGDPFYRAGLDMAGDLVRSAERLRAIRAELDPTEEEVLAYLDENREDIELGPALDTWMMMVRVADDVNVGVGEVDALRIIMRSYLDGLVREAERMIEDRRQIAAERGYLEPERVIDVLAEPTDRRLRTRFRNMGLVTRDNATRELGVEYEELELGRFSEPIITRDGSLVAYYVSEEVPLPPAPQEELEERAREQLIIELSIRDIREQLEQWKEDGEIRYAEELEESDGSRIGG